MEAIEITKSIELLEKLVEGKYSDIESNFNKLSSFVDFIKVKAKANGTLANKNKTVRLLGDLDNLFSTYSKYKTNESMNKKNKESYIANKEDSESNDNDALNDAKLHSGAMGAIDIIDMEENLLITPILAVPLENCGEFLKDFKKERDLILSNDFSKVFVDLKTIAKQTAFRENKAKNSQKAPSEKKTAVASM